MRHTIMHQSSTSMYIPNFTEIGQTFCGWTYRWTDVPTDRWTFPPLMLLGQLGGVDLKMVFSTKGIVLTKVLHQEKGYDN